MFRMVSVNRRMHRTRDHVDVARSLAYMGDTFAALERFDEAASYLNQSLDIHQRVYMNKHHVDLARIAYRLGSALEHTGRHEAALVAFNRSLDIYKRQSGNDAQQNHAAFMLTQLAAAESAHHAGRYQLAIDQLDAALDTFMRHNKLEDAYAEPMVASVFARLGVAHRHLRHLTLSIDLFNRSLQIVDNVHATLMHADAARLYNHMAVSYHMLGEFNTSLELFNRSLGIYTELMAAASSPSSSDDQMLTDIATASFNVATVYSALGEHEAAVRFFNRSLEPFYSSPTTAAAAGAEATAPLIGRRLRRRAHQERMREFAVRFSSLGEAYRQLGRYDESIAFFNKSLDALTRAQAPEADMALVYNDIGVTYMKMKRYEESRSYLHRTVDILATKVDEGRYHYQKIAKTFNNLGVSYFNLGVANESIVYFAKSLEMFTKVITLHTNSIIAKDPPMNLVHS